MEKCETCMLRYNCKGIQEFMCQNGDYKDYVPDEDALEAIQKELDKCKGKVGNEMYIYVIMQDGREFAYLDAKHKAEFNGDWLIIKGGFTLSEIVFAAHKDNMKYMYVGP